MFKNNILYLSFLIESFGVTFLFLSSIRPKLVEPFYYGWLRAGALLNKITSPLILCLLYLLVLTPTSLILRLVKYDPLLLRSSEKATYWKKRDENPQASDDFKNQF
jgi:hypothetical protein